jgi:6-phosphogluconolactonase (cycloisomerase 2 family)
VDAQHDYRQARGERESRSRAGRLWLGTAPPVVSSERQVRVRDRRDGVVDYGLQLRTADGTFTWLQTISTLPSDFTGESSTAEIIVHPSGNWVYGSNRGHNTIVSFRIDQSSGKLKVIDWTSTQGSIPRGFCIDPSGRLLLVGNQNSDSIAPFRINQSGGRLHPTGPTTSTPLPVSFAFGREIRS